MTLRRLGTLAVALWLTTAIASSAETEVVEFDGLRVDFHRVTKQQRDMMTPSLRKQFEIVKGARLPQCRRVLASPIIDGAYRRARSPGLSSGIWRRGVLGKRRRVFREYGYNIRTRKDRSSAYSCSIIFAAQPRFVEYLTSLFGPHPCN